MTTKIVDIGKVAEVSVRLSWSNKRERERAMREAAHTLAVIARVFDIEDENYAQLSGAHISRAINFYYRADGKGRDDPYGDAIKNQA